MTPVTNYDTLVFFDTTNGIQPGPFTLPSTGPAYVKASDHRSSRFFLEGSPKKAGCAFYVTALAPDLSTVHLARYTVNDIPPNPAVQADVDDVNNNVGFWAEQDDFRFPDASIQALPTSAIWNLKPSAKIRTQLLWTIRPGSLYARSSDFPTPTW